MNRSIVIFGISFALGTLITVGTLRAVEYFYGDAVADWVIGALMVAVLLAPMGIIALAGAGGSASSSGSR